MHWFNTKSDLKQIVYIVIHLNISFFFIYILIFCKQVRITGEIVMMKRLLGRFAQQLGPHCGNPSTKKALIDLKTHFEF